MPDGEYPLTTDPLWVDVELCHTGKRSHKYTSGLTDRARHSVGKVDCSGCTQCVFCAVPLSPRHEHDHMPVPAAAGGRDWEPACMNCHDLKDRMPSSDWPIDAFWSAWADAPPLSKILMAKLVADQLRLLAENKALWRRLFEQEPDFATREAEAA